jgi:hypothetical protein
MCDTNISSINPANSQLVGQSEESRTARRVQLDIGDTTFDIAKRYRSGSRSLQRVFSGRVVQIFVQRSADLGVGLGWGGKEGEIREYGAKSATTALNRARRCGGLAILGR